MYKTTKQIIQETEEKIDNDITEAKQFQDYFTEDDEFQIKAHHMRKRWIALNDLLGLMGKMKDRFSAIPKADDGEEQDRFISYLDLKNALTSNSKPKGSTHNKSFTVTKDKPSPPKFCPNCGGRDFVPIKDKSKGQCLGCGFIGKGKTSSER